MDTGYHGYQLPNNANIGGWILGIRVNTHRYVNVKKKSLIQHRLHTCSSTRFAK